MSDAEPRVAASELRAMFGDGAELALLDVREEGVFSKAHLLTAASLPLSRLEMRLDAMVPRRATRIVLCDDNELLAQRAATVMRRFGYRQISVLAGGLGAWKAAGYELFSGVYVPSKAFGEFVEHECATPRIGAAELKAKLDAGEDVVILDSRGNIQAAGVAINGLTVSSHVAFLELDWTTAAHLQAEDRVHRYGQENTVNVYYLIADGTIEGNILQLLDKKQKIVTQILGDDKPEDIDMFHELVKPLFFAFGKACCILCTLSELI